MNGYGSQCPMKPAVLSAIQTTTNALWPTRKRPVPMNLAVVSDSRPKASESYRSPVRGPLPRGEFRSERSSGRIASGSILMCLTLSPARGQDPVQHVIDGDRAEQTAVLVTDGHTDEVVRGHAPGHLFLGKFRPDEPAVLDDLAHHRGRRLAQQRLESNVAEVAPGRGLRGGFADID